MKTKEKKWKKGWMSQSKGPLAIHFAQGCKGYQDDSNAYLEAIVWLSNINMCNAYVNHFVLLILIFVKWLNYF